MPGIELTTLSETEYSRLSSQEMTPEKAAEYLWSGRIVLRTFPDTLREFYPFPDLIPRLISAFQTDAGEDGKPDSIAKNVRNWVSGRSQPTSRETIFHIAFALSLSEPQTRYLLGLCTDYTIHYRDGRETVYAWFLRTGRSYAEARAFYESCRPRPSWTACRPLPTPILPATCKMSSSGCKPSTICGHTTCGTWKTSVRSICGPIPISANT